MEKKKVVLEGKIDIDEFPKYEKMITQPDVWQIDISKFSANVSIEKLEDRIYDDESDDEPMLIVKLLLNKEFASLFVIEDGLVLSADKKVLVNSFDKEKVTIPEGVEIIGHFAFCFYYRMKSIALPDGIKKIGNGSFYFCDLSNVILPDSVECLGDGSFGYCDLDTVKLPNRLKEIPANCFSCNGLMEVNIPSSVKKIGDEAFCCNFITKLTLPEGVESIGYNVFTQIESICFPSTMREIEKAFFYECNVDEPSSCLPYVEVNKDNPLFFSVEGTLYSRSNPDVPYLGYNYMELKRAIKEKDAPVHFPCTRNESQRELSLQEIYAQFPSYNCRPINEDATLFWIYETFNGYNIIDRYMHRYINPRSVRNVQFSFNHFVLLKGNKTAIYSIDLKTILLEECDGYCFESCDEDGRIYVSKDIPMPEEDIRLRKSGILHCSHIRYGCINIHKEVIIPCEYKDLNHFDACGTAVAQVGSKYGIIDLNNNVVIPFLYSSFYQPFDENGIAIVSKKEKKGCKYMYINRKNEVLGIFLSDTFDIYMPGFHIYANNGKYGYAKQFGREYSGAIYEDVQLVDEQTIKVSLDGVNYQEIKY